ncbi:molybdenum cofactor sulfurylase [Roseovarius azorensis]|uniref:Molybdenum cofactor sulfurylase n=1 Tax=Roseovarius azorensis TaxID=1287727 RepID=A0A1H7UXJ9_9RHOB|nr:xanthine dehydrogenase accessory protein XdhC [Roseovarius azorensis]SEM01358.1 molybdenum cofactor sulfurylase [Roseovarius azorensis]
MFDLDVLRAAVAAEGRVARVVIAETRGSAPREAGAAMLVWNGGQSGTIGGGRLEFEAVSAARDMLAGGPAQRLVRQALGPALGQCCGGAVTLVTEIYDAARLDEAAAAIAATAVWARPVAAGAGAPPAAALRRAGMVLAGGWLIERPHAPALPVVIHGAGHVGRALAGVLAPLPEIRVTLADTRPDRLNDLPAGIGVCTDPLTAMDHAPDTAAHLIMTHDHALDLALCHRLLSRDFAFAGLIGSDSKWARFRRRLAALGDADAQVSRITCPIGDPALGKHPQAIAIGIAGQLLIPARTGSRKFGSSFA